MGKKIKRSVCVPSNIGKEETEGKRERKCIEADALSVARQPDGQLRDTLLFCVELRAFSIDLVNAMMSKRLCVLERCTANSAAAHLWRPYCCETMGDGCSVKVLDV
jgi:hypothetical protein